jgi:hypothetical protein
MIHPIGMCIPESKIVPAVSRKEKLYATIVPGKRETYIYGNNEQAYYDDYAQSVFGITMPKAGWDCLRHYEILANGCIPWFQNLDQCPPGTMTHFPKALVIEAMRALAGVTDLNSDAVRHYTSRLLEHTRQHLTTRAMARYVLGQIENQNVSRILFLSADPRPDYIRCLLLHGFKELFGPQCHDALCVPHLYTDFPPEHAAQLYGGGISYTRLLDKNHSRNPALDATLENDIARHHYDIIVYGSAHRGLPHWDLAHRYYADRDILLVCGEDAHTCELRQLAKSHDLFLREQ